MPSKQAQFKWNVQPYRWMREMRAIYLNSVVAVSQAKAEGMAAEATAWMKENAKWTDRTGRARSSLEAYVTNVKVSRTEKTDIAARNSVGLAQARKEEADLLKQLNTERENNYKNTTEYQDELDRELERFESKYGELRKINSDFYRQQIEEIKARVAGKKPLPISKVPEDISPVARFFSQQKINLDAEASLNQNKFPLVNITFHYRSERAYFLWLEVANGGRYAIIGPATNYWGRKFITYLKRIRNLKQLSNLDIQVPSLPETITNPVGMFEAHFAKQKRTYKRFGPEVRAERAYRRGYRKSKEEEHITGKKRKRTSRKGG